jgi:hypothetical protein
MTTDPFALTQSPRTQAFEQPSEPQDEEELFTKSFSDLAYRMFAKTHPELMSALVTFRVLEVDPAGGEGVGAFILRMNQEVFFVPAVIAENTIKPLDMFYARTKDHFYPFTQEWIERVTSEVQTPLGDGVVPPKDLATDVDIRNVMVPPTTGRYSYAADQAWKPFTDLERPLEGPKVFPEVLSKLGNAEKLSMQRFLQKNAQLFQKFAEVYGVKTLRDALTPIIEKKAAATTEVPLKHDVYLATASTPVQEMKQELGSDAPEAYRVVRTRGFYIKDRRPNTPNALLTYNEETMRLAAPTSPGLYRVYLSDGSAKVAVVVPSPISLRGGSFHGALRCSPRLDDPGTEYFVLLEDRRCGILSALVAEPIMKASHQEVADWVKKHTSDAPSPKSHGYFISTADLTIRATDEFWCHGVTDRSDVIVCQSDFGATVVIARNMTGSKIVRPIGEETVMLPGTYRWISRKDGEQLHESDLLSSPQMVERMVELSAEKTGGLRIKVAKAGDGFLVGGDAKPLTALEAFVKVANAYGLSVGESAQIMQAVQGDLPVRAWAFPKTAADKGIGGGSGAPTDPNAQAAMMAQMQAAQQPPPPAGVDLAIAEKIQTIQSQRAALDQMEQMLTEIQGRAQGIDQGGGAMAAPQAAATMAAGPQSQMMGQPLMAPVPGMDPTPPAQGAAGSQQPAPGGMPQPASGPQGPAPGMDPSTGGQPGGMSPGQPGASMGGQPGMDPSMGGPSGQPSMDPAMMQPQQPPQPVMPRDPNPALFEQEVSPQFLGEAAQLGHEGVFDASAVASLANVRSIRDILQNYAPTLDNAMDRLGRTLLLIYIKSKTIKERIGDEAYVQFEQNLQDVFHQMGDALMAIEQYGSQLLPDNTRRT